MAAKRGPTSDLNYDNWDKEGEVEVQGTFQKAPEDTLKNRVIRTAKRRNPIRPEDEDSKKSAFASFTGFSSKPQNTDFSFLKNMSNTDSAPKANGIDNKKTTKSDTFFKTTSNTSTSNKTNIFGAIATTTSASTNIFESTLNSKSTSSKTVPSSSTGTNKSDKYCAKLKGLNESVSRWIVKKVEENPLISLQPIFKDYDKYLDEIERDEQNAQIIKPPDAPEKSIVTSNLSFNFAPSANKNNIAIPDSTTEKITDKKDDSPSSKSFTFKTSAASSTVTSIPTFTFGSVGNASGTSLNSSTSTLTSNSLFNFGSKNSDPSSGSTVPVAVEPAGNDKKSEETDKPKPEATNNENNEDEPPKVEFQPVIEKDSIYTIRCKVFVKKGDKFGDRGVGNLYLKTIENSDKVQLIVRADTNLGNLLLNFILSASVPTKRLGKKDVMLVAVPTPDSKPPPVPLLLRVKSPEDADTLLEVLEKHKK